MNMITDLSLMKELFSSRSLVLGWVWSYEYLLIFLFNLINNSVERHMPDVRVTSS